MKDSAKGTAKGTRDGAGRSPWKQDRESTNSARRAQDRKEVRGTKFAAIQPAGFTMRAELGESSYGSPEPRLVLAWEQAVTNAAGMAQVFAACSRICLAAEAAGIGGWATPTPPFAVSSVGRGRSQATITIETMKGTKAEAEQAMAILREIANG
jgi:hypothetical protein